MAYITLTWDALPEDSIAVWIRVYEVLDGPTYDLVAEVDADETETSFTATDGTHYYVLRTVDSVGNESDIGDVIEAAGGEEPEEPEDDEEDEEDTTEWSSTGCIFSFNRPLQPINPWVILQYSDDGGQTWSNEYWRSPGGVGEYKTRVRWNRLGRSRDRVFRIVVSDPCKWILTDAMIDTDLGTSRR